MVFNLLAPIAGAVVGGLMQGRSQSQATRAQQQVAQQGFEAEERMARENLAFQQQMLNNMAMAGFPRQQASNAALQHITDLYGLGDIYAAPAPGQLGGPADFYPATNIPGAQGMAMPQGQLPMAQLPQFNAPQNIMGFHPGAAGGGGFGLTPDMRIY